MLEKCSKIMESMCEPRIVEWSRIHKPQSNFDKFFSWMGYGYRGEIRVFTGVKVNLKTKEVSISFLNHIYK